MKPIRHLLLGAALLALTAPNGFAQQSFSLTNGLYLRGDLGGAFGTDTTFKDTNTGSASCSLCGTTQPSSTGNSVLFGGGIGYRFNPAFRADVTLDYIPSFDVSGHNSVATSVTNKADLSSLVGLVNGYLDIDGLVPNVFGPLQPFLTAGVGVARNDLEKTTYAAPGLNSGVVTQNGDARADFAWGAGAGVGYALTPNLTLDLSYKYLDLGDMRSSAGLNAAGATFTPIKAELQAHTVMLGLRFAFGAPPAPPPAPAPVAAPPAPPPAAAVPAKQVFIVFFEFDKSSLTPDGRKVVDEAAAAFKNGKTGVAVAGYTDLAGTAQYNMALSKRRADTVKAALIRDGVAASAIDESWHGKQDPRVPTADGVREPQNRRVEITM